MLPFRLTSNGICWCLLGSDGVWWCLLVCHVVCRCGDGVSGVCQRVSERCLWTCVSFGASEGVSESSGQVWYSKCSELEKLRKAKFHTLDTFEISKHQNRPIQAPWKSLGYSTFWHFRACQKQISCGSLFWSPCRLLGRAKNISCIQDQYIDVLPNLTSGGITCGKGWGERSIKERSRLFSDPWIPLYSPMLSLTYQWTTESDLSGNIRLIISKYRVPWV